MANKQSVSPFQASLLESSMMESYYVDHANMYELEKDTIADAVEKVWITYCLAAFQTYVWRRDNDPKSEVDKDTEDHPGFKYSGLNLGITRGDSSLDSLAVGGEDSYIPFETLRDYGSSGAVNFDLSEYTGRSIAHEIGHQFGLGHSGNSSLMNASLNDTNNDGEFSSKHINLIRSRKNSPGTRPN
ncbi:reprolysin-like metallopeptidase [Phaeodactylibacter xiamenensis]|uniref:reprolysin-like metallopeptidase n=1 Tax=Phaeodactylibacter xiamenensis TaxID=1524460 RepID=UPI003BACAC0F